MARARMGCGTHTFAIRTRLLAAFLALCFWPLFASSQAEQASAAVDLSGQPVDPLKAAPGKVVVLIFVRTDCPISNRYAPTILRLSALYAGKAAFWLVYPDKAESPGAIRKHERDFGYQLPALRDVHRSLVKESRAQITPEAAVFDANHRLVYHGRIDNLYEDFGRARTAATTHELDDAIRAAIDGKTLPADTARAVGCYISDLE
jgi:thiol-disulfide isomerase/thioredoxin